MTHRATPPFRADQVGSLLRPAALKQARADRAAGAITADELREIEDREIKALIRKQEAVGLQSITDGEFRRKSWQTDFVSALPGIETVPHQRNVSFQGGVQLTTRHTTAVTPGIWGLHWPYRKTLHATSR